MKIWKQEGELEALYALLAADRAAPLSTFTALWLQCAEMNAERKRYEGIHCKENHKGKLTDVYLI